MCSSSDGKGIIMAFVYEIVPEKDYEFFKSMQLRDCSGAEKFTLNEKRTKWCADRQRNAFLIDIGGGYGDIPHFHDLWWNGCVTRIITSRGGKGNYKSGIDIIWFVKKMPISQELWIHRLDIYNLIRDGLYVDSSWCPKEYLKSVSVIFECEPQIQKTIRGETIWD